MPSSVKTPARICIGCSGPRVLGIELDPLELGLGAHPLDLELGNEDGHVSRDVCGERDRPLGREEAEAREVLDVVLAEEHVARERVAPDVLEERLASGE
jgi:hypothetical protein